MLRFSSRASGLREGTAGVTSLVFTFLIFSFLMVYMVPQFRPVVPQGQLGLLEDFSKLTGIATYWVVGAIIAGVISLSVFTLFYLAGTRKLSELL